MLSDQEKRFPVLEVPLNGKLITVDASATIGMPNFQRLENFYYGERNPKPVSGATKVNTVATAQTALRSGHHFRKGSPSESHVLVEGGGVVYDASAVAVPGQDTFTSIYTDPAGALAGRYADVPGGLLCRCTGKEALLWGGAEHRVSKFLDYPTTSKIYDYSEVVQNNLTDANNLATIHSDAVPAPDANTMLLLHLDNNVTDSSPISPHTVTNSNVTYSTGAKFGTHAAVFNGTTSRLTIPDNADFNFSGGVWSIDLWARTTASGANQPLYYQQNSGDANDYVRIYLNKTSGKKGYLNLEIKTASSVVVTLTSSLMNDLDEIYSHFSVVENGDNFYMFRDGTLVGYLSSAGRAANCTGTVYIGNDGSTNWYTGRIDEYRVSNSARWTSAFSVPVSSYDSSYTATIYLASILPLKGGKIYVETANNQASTMAWNEWNGSAWSALAITDNTAVGGITLAQTGTVTFASTIATSKQKAFFKTLAYWYQIVIISSADFGGVPKISRVTVDMPMQPVKDLWDGETHKCIAFLANIGSAYKDYTTNVYDDSYTSTGSTADTATYASIGAMATSDFVIKGFSERQMGVIVNVISGQGNTNAAQLEVAYWDGDEWIVLAAEDGTLEGTASFAKSGWVTWNPPDSINEQKQSVFASKDRGPTYYYRFKFNAALSATVNVYHVAGIPTPQDIRGYSFAVQHQNRLILGDNYDNRRNSIKITSSGTANVLNGADSYNFDFGNDEQVVAGASLFTRVGSSVASVLVVCKAGETWTIIGTIGGEIVKDRVSRRIGCVAPRTMCEVPEGQGSQLPGVPNNAAVWVSSRGVESFDGYRFTLLSRDIGDKFDPKHANYFGASAIASATAWYNATYHALHLCIQGSFEWVYSFVKQAWSQINRTTKLYGAFPVQDTNGISYCYGFANNGFAYRLDNGATWDGTAISYAWRIADLALYEGRIVVESQLRFIKHIAKANNDVAATISVVHYTDGDTTGKTLTAMSPQIVGRNLAQIVRSDAIDGVFHSTEFTMSCNAGSIAYEPLYLAYYFDPKTLDKGFSVNSPRT